MTTQAVPAHPSDEEVVQSILGGDVAGFETLMRRHNQRVYRAVRAVLRDDDEVEDVMQQAYLNAYRNLRQFNGSALFSTWLTRIAVNAAVARLRKRGSTLNEGDTTMLHLVDTNARDPERDAAAGELRRLLEEEVTSLPDTFRVVFMLRDVEGLSTSEAAAALDISDDLVKTRLHRARRILRDRLDQRTGVTLASAFPFGLSRCDRVVSVVMEQIALGA